MNDKSLFREIAKKVHPDMNSEFTSGAKMREVIANKNRPHVLLNLARKWGLNLDGSFNKFAFDKRADEFARTVYKTVIGAIIRHTFTHKRKIKILRGVIVDIHKIKKGHHSGGFVFKIYDFENNELWNMKTMESNPFTIVGMADKDIVNEGQEKVEFQKTQKKNIAKHKQKTADDQFKLLDLKKNKRYNDVEVLVRYKQGPKWETLIRTTPKSVYIPGYNYKNNERRINIRSIDGSRYKEK